MSEQHVAAFKWSGFIAVCLAAVALSWWFDTMDYRDARRVFTVGLSFDLTKFDIAENGLQADLDRSAECVLPLWTQKQTPEVRSCLIGALQQTTTVWGVLHPVTQASVWLSFGPDEDVKAAAIDALISARMKISTTEAWRYEALSRLSDAHEHSVFLRLFSEHNSAANRLAKDTAMLDSLQIAIEHSGGHLLAGSAAALSSL